VCRAKINEETRKKGEEPIGVGEVSATKMPYPRQGQWVIYD